MKKDRPQVARLVQGKHSFHKKIRGTLLKNNFLGYEIFLQLSTAYKKCVMSPQLLSSTIQHHWHIFRENWYTLSVFSKFVIKHWTTGSQQWNFGSVCSFVFSCQMFFIQLTSYTRQSLLIKHRANLLYWHDLYILC